MNNENSEKTQVADDKTVVATRRTQETHTCPVCNTVNPLEQLQKREYRCSQCNLELAHLDYNVNGAVRGVFGWLLAPGEVVMERYQIQSVLGKGGFGAAYLVDDLQLNNRRRALKEVPQTLFDEYETTLLSRLDHPAIPDIIERRILNGMVYLVLKFGGSRTLGSERKQNPERRIPLDKLLPWMRQLCEVLIYLHAQNPPIIHRDLKPDNILLNEEERIMLIDFGIAKEAVPEGLTRTLGRAATHGFSPPEQVMGTGTDERADIYALGATFYALLTGKNPPAAHERVAGKELVPPSEIIPEVSPELEETLLQALSLNMHHRQQTVRDFASGLEGIEVGEASRSVRTDSQASRTVAMGGPSTRLPTGGKPTGLKLPTGRVTAGAGKSSREIAPVAHRNVVMPLVGMVAVLAALAAGIYWFWLKPSAQPETAAVQPPPAQLTPSVQTPAMIPPVQTQTQPTPSQVVSPAVTTPYPTPSTVPATQPPVANIPPASTTPSDSGGGSAAEMLKGRTPSVAEPVEPPPPATVYAPAEVRSKPPKPKPVVRVQPAAPVERSRPKPASGGGEPSWTIIPGGAHKTD